MELQSNVIIVLFIVVVIITSFTLNYSQLWMTITTTMKTPKDDDGGDGDDGNGDNHWCGNNSSTEVPLSLTHVPALTQWRCLTGRRKGIYCN